MTTTLAISSGCPSGIGLELLIQAAPRLTLPPDTFLRFCGPPSLLLLGAKRAQMDAFVDDTRVGVGEVVFQCEPEAPLPVALKSHNFTRPSAQQEYGAGQPTAAALEVQRDSLLYAIALARAGDVDGLVTLPIRKRALEDVGGKCYPGHTELLSEKLDDGAGPALMVFANGPFLLGLATVHLPLAKVSEAITQNNVAHSLQRLLDVTRAFLPEHRRAHPKVVVLGHNPHAGEDGLLGTEEIDAIVPAIAQTRHEDGGANIIGPLPADGFFAHFQSDPPDAVLAMHHDQGLGPYKILSEGKGVNLTWGLRCVRTSPDHGTADLLAGTATADPGSLVGAIELCARLAQKK